MTQQHVLTGSVSWGTHRHQDLIPRFLDVLRYFDKELGEEFAQDIPAEVWDDEEHEWWYSEEAAYLLDDLIYAIDEFAPEGYFFGTHPGDGSDFGFWPIDWLG